MDEHAKELIESAEKYPTVSIGGILNIAYQKKKHPKIKSDRFYAYKGTKAYRLSFSDAKWFYISTILGNDIENLCDGKYEKFIPSYIGDDEKIFIIDAEVFMNSVMDLTELESMPQYNNIAVGRRLKKDKILNLFKVSRPRLVATDNKMNPLFTVYLNVDVSRRGW